MTKAPPIRRGLPRTPVPAPAVSPARHAAAMALRFTVQGDSEAETAEGLRMLLSLGLQKRLNPTDMISNGWMARAVLPPTTKTPTEDDRGPAAPSG